MPFAPELAGPQETLLVTPPRRAHSIRRTTSIDTDRHRLDGVITVEARARDVGTDHAGALRLIGAQRLSARLDESTTAIQELEAEPALAGLDALRGRSVGPGFRQVALDLLPNLIGGSLLAHLLDDWSGAQLVSGYALQRRWTAEEDHTARTPTPPERLAGLGDICAGWANGGSIMVALGRTGVIPTPMGPLMPSMETNDDRDAWHVMPPLAAGATRRRRRIDLWVQDDTTLGFDSHFRDSHGEDAHTQSGLHEYRVSGVLSQRDLAVVSLDVQVLTLPWKECPTAQASAQRLVGRSVAGLRPLVRADFTGTTTCTHLNDTLRVLEDLATLADELRG